MNPRQGRGELGPRSRCSARPPRGRGHLAGPSLGRRPAGTGAAPHPHRGRRTAPPGRWCPPRAGPSGCRAAPGRPGRWAAGRRRGRGERPVDRRPDRGGEPAAAGVREKQQPGRQPDGDADDGLAQPDGDQVGARRAGRAQVHQREGHRLDEGDGQHVLAGHQQLDAHQHGADEGYGDSDRQVQPEEQCRDNGPEQRAGDPVRRAGPGVPGVGA